MYVNPTTHPLHTFVLSSSTSTNGVVGRRPAEQFISDTLEKIVTIRADYSGYDLNLLPKDFEPQNGVWKEWLVPAMNQGSCGSCWTFASVAALSDRFNVLMRKRFLKESLSPLAPTICNNILSILFADNPQHLETVQNPFTLSAQTLENFACHGNSLITACYYLFSQGTTSEACMSYTLPSASLIRFKAQTLNWGFPFQNSVYFPPNVGKTIYDYSNFSTDQNKGTCAFYNQTSSRPFAYCNDFLRVNSTKNYGSPQQHFQALLMYQVKGAVKDNRYLMMDIFQWGPVCSAFTVYDDFYDFDPKKTPVYIHDPQRTNIVGGHAVEIVGWGTHGTTPFWWVKNSWGPEYGYQGYFRFLRGKDQCSLETNALSMLPNLFFPLQRISFLRELEASLQSLGIFQTHYTEEANQLQQRIAQTFEPLAADIVQATNKKEQESVRSQEFVIAQFPLLQYHALSRIGYLTTDILTPSNYNSTVYRTLPGLYLGVPFSIFPYTRDFMAGNVEKEAPKKQQVPLWTLMVVLLVLLVFIVLFLLLLRYPKKATGKKN